MKKIRSKQYTICSNSSLALYLIYSSIYDMKQKKDKITGVVVNNT